MSVLLQTRQETTPQSEIGATLLRRVESLLAFGWYRAALDGLCAGLTEIRESMDEDEWTAFTQATQASALSRFVREEPLTARAFDKPRGYAGDAVMMDFVYGLHGYHQAVAGASAVGKGLLSRLRARPACTSVQDRREHIAQLIDDLAAQNTRPDVLAIAAGHLREVECSQAIQSGRTGRVLALDADAESLREVDHRYGRFGVETMRASVRSIIARKVDVGAFDLVYAAGLYDYLSDTVARALTARLFDLTKPGGWLLVPNFAPSCPDRAYLEAFMAWDLIYRDEFDMQKLLELIPGDRIASYDIYSGRTGSIVYLLVHKTE